MTPTTGSSSPKRWSCSTGPAAIPRPKSWPSRRSRRWRRPKRRPRFGCAKGGPRTLFVHRDLVESYVDYALERRKILSQSRISDHSPHVFVNLYSEDRWLGRAESYSTVKRLMDRCSKRIGHDITGPHTLRHTFAT